MPAAFSEWRVPAGGREPERSARALQRGVVFANEFFDALPVDAAVCRNGGFRQMLVGLEDGRFRWVEGGAVPPEAAEYIARLPRSVRGGLSGRDHLEALA